MNKYVTELNLEYDPFAPDSPSGDFYAGGERRLLVDQIIELSLEGSMLAVVTGPRGSGKTTLAREVRRNFGEDAVCLQIPATLFMTQAQFLDALGKQLPKHKHIAATPDVATGITRLRQFAAELDLEAQSLILVVDDAHELSGEVLELIDEIAQSASSASVRAILLGEKPLINLLQNTLPEDSQANLAHFDLVGFDIEETEEYLRFKLVNAGLDTSMPLSSEVIAEIQNAANGIPGTLHALAADALLAIDSQDTEDMATVDPAEPDSDLDEVPPGKNFNFDAHDHMQFDLDMADLDDDEVHIEADRSEAEESDADAVPLTLYQQVERYRYPLAASSLAVILLITVVVWNSDEGPALDSNVADAGTLAAGGNINRIELSPPLPVADTASNAPAAVPSSTPAPATPLAQVIDTPAAATAPLASGPATTAPAAAAVTQAIAASAPVIAAANPAPTRPQVSASETGATAAVAAPAVPPEKPVIAEKPAEKPAPAVTSKLSAFEQELLQHAPNSYTIQILGSHSEPNVQAFLAGKPLTEKHGYYETRHQNKAWFVVVAGNYSDRAAATAVIDRLPSALRNMQPWIRSVGDIQRDIRQLHDL